MKESICGANCNECPSKESCAGCGETNGCPFGKKCYIANYILTEGKEAYRAFRDSLIAEVNALHIDGMDAVTELYPLVGSFVNLEYPLPNDGSVKFLKDDEMYLGAQVSDRRDESGKTCYGVIAREDFLLVCTYGENCNDPLLVLYRRR